MQIKSAVLRSNCFNILNNTERSHDDVIITKRGKPIAKLVPIDPGTAWDPLLGALAGAGRTIGDLTEPVSDNSLPHPHVKTIW